MEKLSDSLGDYRARAKQMGMNDAGGCGVSYADESGHHSCDGRLYVIAGKSVCGGCLIRQEKLVDEVGLHCVPAPAYLGGIENIIAKNYLKLMDKIQASGVDAKETVELVEKKYEERRKKEIERQKQQEEKKEVVQKTARIF